MFTQEELDQFYKDQPTTTPEGEGGLPRLGQQIANLPSSILQSFIDTGGAIAKLVAPKDDLNQIKVPHPFDVGDIGSTGHPILDIAAGHLVPELAASLIPFTGASRVAKLAGAGERIADVVGNVAAGAFTGIKASPEEAAHQSLVNAGLTLLPGGAIKKLIPALGLSGTDAAYEYVQHQDAGAAVQTAAMDMGFAYLPNVANAIMGKIPFVANNPGFFRPAEGPTNADVTSAPYQGHEMSGMDAFAGRINAPPSHEERWNAFKNLDEDMQTGPWVSPMQGPGEGALAQLPNPEGPDIFGLAGVGKQLQSIKEPQELSNEFRDLNQIKSPLLSPHLQESTAVGADIQLPHQTQAAAVDEFFRLLEPPRAPEDFPTYQGGDIVGVPEEISNKRDIDKIKSQIKKPRPVKTKVSAPAPELGATVVESKPELQQAVVRVNTPRGAVDAVVNSFEDGVFNVTIDDPIHGTRQTSVSEFNPVTKERQVFPKTKPVSTPKEGVPFQDIKSVADISDPTALHEEVQGREQNISQEELIRREEANQRLGMRRRTNPGEFGFANPQILFPLAGATAGSLQGETPEEHLENALLGGLAGVAGGKLYGHLMRSPLEKDAAAQAFMLKRKASQSGHATVSEWASAKPEEFIAHAKGWREEHPLPALKRRAGEAGAIDISGQPLRTKFEESATTNEEGQVEKIGNRSIPKSGIVDLNAFKNASGINADELAAYQLHIPEAFESGKVDLNKLKAGLETSPLIEVVELPHDEGSASAESKATANLQHILDTHESGKFYIDEGNIVLGENAHILSEEEIAKLHPDIQKAWNSYKNLDWTVINPQDEARSASVRYESYEINPRPLEELQQKEGYDQLVKVPVKMVGRDDRPLHQSSHFNEGDASNIIGFTRGYADTVPGKAGKSEIIYEYQGDWAQQRREYFEEHPLIESPDKLPEGFQIHTGNIKGGGVRLVTKNGNFTSASTPEQAIKKYNEVTLRNQPKDHPLLNEYKRLALKARVDKAIADGRKGIMLTDADTVLMTEGHDKIGSRIEKLSHDDLGLLPSALQDKYDKNGIYAKVHGQHTSKTVRVDKPEENLKSDIKIARELNRMYEGGKKLPKEGEYYIPTREGMVENYDRSGKNILKELTGVEPEHISLGESSHRASSMVDDKDMGGYYSQKLQGSKALGGKSDISGWWFDLTKLAEKRQKTGMTRSPLMGKTGISNVHLLTTLAGAAWGGEEGYRKSGGDPSKALAGAVMAGAAGFLGFKVIEALMRANPRLNLDDLKGIKREMKGAAEAIMTKTARDLSGEEVRAEGGIMSKFIKGIEFWGRFHVPPELITAWTRAHGAGVLAIKAVKDSVQSLRDFVPDKATAEAATKFIEGKFLNEADATAIVLEGGGMSDEAWKALDKSAKPGNFTRWEVGDKAFWMPESTKQNLIGAEEDAFKSFLTDDKKDYFNFIRTARRSLDNLQHLFSEGLPDGDLKNLLKNSVGQYVTRTYKIFNDPQHYPTEAHIQNAMGELGAHYGRNGIDFNEDLLRKHVVDYLHELKENKASLGFGISGKSKIDSTLLKEREDISPTFRELLGEYTDPKERILASISRLFPSAAASKFISMAAKMDIEGIPASLSRDEWLNLSNKFHDIVDNLKGRPSLTPDQTTVLTDAQTKIRRLMEYVKLDKNLKYGEFSNTYANRFVSDQLRGIDPHLAGMDHPIFRTMAKFNTVAKVAHTAYDHIRIVRNIITVPMFMWIGKATPQAVNQALNLIKTQKGPMWEEAIREGILGADQVTAEYRGSVDHLFNGNHDSGLTSVLKNVHNKILDWYRIPDAATRLGTYLDAKSRYSVEMNLPQDHPNVIKAAVEWTDRRTINYENVSPFVRVARNVPFFNLYISYASEIARVVKNLSLDAVGKGPTGKVDLQALAQLGVLAGVFEGIQAGAEAMLSSKDREDWQRANRQGANYSRSRYKIPYSRDSKGNFNYIDLTPLLVTDSFNQTFRSLAKGDVAGATAVNPVVGWDNSPVFNILQQLNSGTDMHTKRQLQNFEDKATVIARELSPSWTPGIGYEWQKVASIGTENLKTGRAENWPGTLVRSLTGLNVTSVNPSALDRQALAQLKQEISNERAYLGDVLKMKGISKEKQDRAVSQYQKAVQTAIGNYITQRNKNE